MLDVYMVGTWKCLTDISSLVEYVGPQPRPTSLRHGKFLFMRYNRATAEVYSVRFKDASKTTLVLNLVATEEPDHEKENGLDWLSLRRRHCTPLTWSAPSTPVACVDKDARI